MLGVMVGDRSRCCADVGIGPPAANGPEPAPLPDAGSGQAVRRRGGLQVVLVEALEDEEKRVELLVEGVVLGRDQARAVVPQPSRVLEWRFTG